MKVGTMDLDYMRIKSNRMLWTLLKDVWLDEDTVKFYLIKQRKLQAKPFDLERLVREVRDDIFKRKKYYGT